MLTPMHTAIGALFFSALATAAQPAAARYVQVDYAGTITVSASVRFPVGTPVDYRLKFDPATFVDHTATLNAVLEGFGLPANFYASALSSALSDDPHASLSITVGKTPFTKFDAQGYGTPGYNGFADLGVGNFPSVFYLDGAFRGAAGVFTNRAGYTLYNDPVAADIGSFGRHGFGFTQTVDGDPFGLFLGAGDYDPSTAVFTEVPEPSSLAIVIASAGFTAAITIRRRSALAR